MTSAWFSSSITLERSAYPARRSSAYREEFYDRNPMTGSGPQKVNEQAVIETATGGGLIKH